MKLSVSKSLDKAKRHIKNGERPQAAALYREILEKFPNNTRAKDGLAALAMPDVKKGQIKPTQAQVNALIGLLSQKRFSELFAQSSVLAKKFPRSGVIYNIQGSAHADMEHFNEAISAFAKAIRVEPTYAEAHSNLGNAYQSSGEIEKAKECFRAAIKLKPNFPEAHNNLGNALGLTAAFDEAIECFERALNYKPNYIQAHKNYVIVLLNKGDLDGALKHVNQICEIDPTDHASQADLATHFRNNDRPDDAIECYSRALKVDPQNTEMLRNRGLTKSEMGDFDGAISDFEKALLIKPNDAETVISYSRIVKIPEDSPFLKQIREYAEDTALDKKSRMFFQYSVAKAECDLGNCQSAVEHFVKANTLQRDVSGYNKTIEIERVRKTKKFFDGRTLHPQTSPALTAAPIFILGMPRSGTTLTEQIVSSHSDVAGAGEIATLFEAVTNFAWKANKSPEQTFQEIRTHYANKLAKYPGAKRVTDKTPFNFHWIGFLLNALPEAKIIHTVRQPEAVCWSIFRQSFQSTLMEFSCGMQEITNYYRQYKDLMEFWHENYPGRIYDLDYQKLTENQEAETRRLFEYLELEWQDAALDFHKNKRAVRTASSIQVRSKMYTGSSQEWEKYKPWLQPMLDGLKTP